MEKEIIEFEKKSMLETLDNTPWPPTYDSEKSHNEAIEKTAEILGIKKADVSPKMLTACSIFEEEDIKLIKIELLEELKK